MRVDVVEEKYGRLAFEQEGVGNEHGGSHGRTPLKGEVDVGSAELHVARNEATTPTVDKRAQGQRLGA